MSTSEEELVKINQQTFDAEAQELIGEEAENWKDYLQRVLSDDFRIRRSDPAVPLQDKQAMVEFIEGRPPLKRNVSEVKPFVYKGFGVVTSVIRVGDRSDRYHNLKVFAKTGPEQWQCVYWQVSKIDDRQ